MDKTTTKYKYPEFSNAILKLKPEELLGVAHFLGVKLYTDEKDKDGKPVPQDGMVIIAGILNKYETLGRKVRRELLKIVKQAGKE